MSLLCWIHEKKYARNIKTKRLVEWQTQTLTAMWIWLKNRTELAYLASNERKKGICDVYKCVHDSSILMWTFSLVLLRWTVTFCELVALCVCVCVVLLQMIYIYRRHRIDTFRLIPYANNNILDVKYLMNILSPYEILLHTNFMARRWVTIKIVKFHSICLNHSLKRWKPAAKSESLWYHCVDEFFRFLFFFTFKSWFTVEKDHNIWPHRSTWFSMRTLFTLLFILNIRIRKHHFCRNYTEFGLVTAVTLKLPPLNVLIQSTES